MNTQSLRHASSPPSTARLFLKAAGHAVNEHEFAIPVIAALQIACGIAYLLGKMNPPLLGVLAFGLLSRGAISNTSMRSAFSLLPITTRQSALLHYFSPGGLLLLLLTAANLCAWAVLSPMSPLAPIEISRVMFLLLSTCGVIGICMLVPRQLLPFATATFGNAKWLWDVASVLLFLPGIGTLDAYVEPTTLINAMLFTGTLVAVGFLTAPQLRVSWQTGSQAFIASHLLRWSHLADRKPRRVGWSAVLPRFAATLAVFSLLVSSYGMWRFGTFRSIADANFADLLVIAAIFGSTALAYPWIASIRELRTLPISGNALVVMLVAITISPSIALEITSRLLGLAVEGDVNWKEFGYSTLLLSVQSFLLVPLLDHAQKTKHFTAKLWIIALVFYAFWAIILGTCVRLYALYRVGDSKTAVANFYDLPDVNVTLFALGIVIVVWNFYRARRRLQTRIEIYALDSAAKKTI